MSHIARRIRRLDADETGAQAAEYAMVGGVGACICALLVEIVSGGFVGNIIDSLGEGIQRVLTGWF